MASSCTVPVVVDLDDEDVAAFSVATPPPSRKRSHGAAASRGCSPDPFSSSPLLHKRLLLLASKSGPIDLEGGIPPPPRRRPSSAPEPPVLLLDDDETDPSLVAGTPPDSDIVVAETPGFTSSRSARPPAVRGCGSSSAGPAHKSSGASRSSIPISLDSDDDESKDDIYRELTGLPRYKTDQNDDDGAPTYGQPLHADLPHEDSTLPDADVGTGKKRPQGEKKHQNEEEKINRQEAKRLKEEEKAKRAEERKENQQKTKMLKEARKAELAEAKKNAKEVSKWVSGKYALECITMVIDSNIVEKSSVRVRLLDSLKEKGLKTNIIKNRFEKSILWRMKVPGFIAQGLSSPEDGCDITNQDQYSVIELPYIAIVLDAEEFCDLVNKNTIFCHVQDVLNEYPTYTVCYVTNNVTGYINKRDQIHFRNKTRWPHPPVEKVFSRLATHYANVHSRQCIDEAEVAEHLVGLTTSLATCKFRKPLTWLSIKANGAIVPDNFIYKDLAKKDTWLKSLIAIPGVQPKKAHAIWKEYRCMGSLLNVYMDPNKTVDEKEHLLSDLKCEDNLGNVSQKLGPKCSRRVYRMLMAENGDLDTDSAEAGA